MSWQESTAAPQFIFRVWLCRCCFAESTHRTVSPPRDTLAALPLVLCLRPVPHGVFAGSAFPSAALASSNRVLNSQYASEISLFKLKAWTQARRGQMCNFLFSINRKKRKHVYFWTGQESKTSPAKRRTGGGRRAGLSSITQRFWHRIIVYFSISRGI